MVGGKHILVAGVGGTGKSYAVAWMRAEGIAAFDGDTVPGLARFVTLGGEPASFPRGADGAWITSHRYIWDLAVLRALLATTQQLYLFGFADNLTDALPLFARCYHLRASPALLMERLQHPTRHNWMGETAEQRTFVLRQREWLADLATRHAIPALDATLAPEALYAAISR